MQPGEGDALKKVNLTDKSGTNYDLIIKGGDRNILETPSGVEPVLSGGARRWGAFDPHHGNIEVSTWERGWGNYDLVDDDQRFEFSKNMWTATSKRMFNTPLAKHVTGQEDYYYNNLTGAFTRMSSPLKIGGQQTGWYAQQFTSVNATDVKRAFVWIKYEDDITITDATISCDVYSDSSGSPNASLGASSQVLITEANMKHWYLVELVFSTAVSISAATDYWLVFKCDAGTGGDMTNFLVSVGKGGTGKKSLNDGSSWGVTYTVNCCFKPTTQKVKNVRLVELQKTFFKLILYKDGTNQLWMNGDHGKATSATASTLVDTGMGVRTSWTTNQWAGATVIIVAGKGVGQERGVTSSTNAGSLTLATDWDITPDTTSEYALVLLDDWYEIPSGTHSLSAVKNVISAENKLYFAMGYGVNMRRMRFNGSAVQFADDGTNDANILFFDGRFIWKGTNDDGVIAYATKQTGWTNLTFTSASQPTPITHEFTGANLHGGNIYFFKENGIYFLNANDPKATIYPYPTNMTYFTAANNGYYSVPNGEYLFFSWGHSIERLAGFSVEHVDPNRDRGMDSDYKGELGGLAPHPAGTFFAVKGSKSSVNIFDGLGFHNAWTSQVTGFSIHDIAWFTSETSNPTLLIAWEEGIVYQRYPKNTANPLQDDNLLYETQGELTTAVIDMSNKSIPKMFKDLAVFVENVTNIPPTFYGEVLVFYKKDSGSWTYLTQVTNISRGIDESSFTDPTLSTINALSNINELQLRFYCIRSDGGTPSIVYAHTLKGFARTPIKSIYSFPIDVSAVTERLGSGTPSTMMDQFWTWAMAAEALLMTSQHPRLHNKTVIIIPRSIRTAYIDRANESFAADFYLELREV